MAANQELTQSEFLMPLRQEAASAAGENLYTELTSAKKDREGVSLNVDVPLSLQPLAPPW